MSKGLKTTLIVILVLLIVLFIVLAIFTRSISSDMLHHPMEERIAEGLWPPEETPEDLSEDSEEE